jgi:hypothetical protein
MRDIASLVETYLNAERDLVAAVDAAAGSMTREAALLLFNSVHVTVSTICRIGSVYAQARIETE